MSQFSAWPAVRRSILGIAATALLAGPAPLMAQAQKSDFQVTDLRQESLEPEYRGKAVMADGSLAAGAEDHFTVADASAFAPTAVTLITKDPAKPMTVRLGKFDWKEDFGGGTTDGSGSTMAKFRTQGDLLITVSAPQGGDYSLLVWSGDDVPPPTEPVLVSPSEAGGGGLFANKALLAGLAVLLLGGIGWFVMRSRRKGVQS